MHKVIIEFKDGRKPLIKEIENYNLACNYADNAWHDLQGVMRTSVREVK